MSAWLCYQCIRCCDGDDDRSQNDARANADPQKLAAKQDLEALAARIAKDPMERWPKQFRAVAFALLLMFCVLAVSAAGAFAPYLMFEHESCVNADGKEGPTVAACEKSILKIQLGLFFSRLYSEVEVQNRNNVFINDGLGRELQLCFRPEIDAKGFNIVFPDQVKARCARVQTHAKATAGLVASSLACLAFGALYLNVGLRPPGANLSSKEPEAEPGERYYKGLRRALNISKCFAFLAVLASFGASILWATRDAFDFKKPSLDGFRNLTLEDFQATILEDLGPGWPLEVAAFVLSVVCLVRVHSLHTTCKNMLETPVPKLGQPTGSANDAVGTTRFEPAPVVNGDNGRSPPAQMTMGEEVPFGIRTTRVAPAPVVSDYNGTRALPTAMGMQHTPHAAPVVSQRTTPSQVPPYTTNTAHAASAIYISPGEISYAASSTQRSGMRRETVDSPTEKTGGRRGTDRAVEFRDSRMPTAVSPQRWTSD